MTEEVKPKGYKKLIVGVIVVAVIVIVLFIPMIPVEVTYSETEPYTRLAKYEVVSATLKEELEFFGRWTYHASEIVVKNIDSEGGTFTVKHRLYDVYGLYDIEITNEYLSAGQTKTFRAEFDTQFLQDVRGEYTVSAPTVIDERVVTKQKTVYKSIIELLIYG